MKYLRKFQTQSEFNASVANGDLAVPNVSLITDTGVVHYTNMVIKESIKGDGKAYIKTDYYPSNYDVIEFNFNDYGALNRCVFGCKGTAFWCSVVRTQDSKGYYAWDNPASVFIRSSGKGVSYIGMNINNGVYSARLIQPNINELIYSYSGAPEEKVSDVPLYIFGFNLANSEEIDSRIFAGTINYITIRDSRTNEVKASYIPALKDGAGMYEVISGKFYGNANTEGSFSVA